MFNALFVLVLIPTLIVGFIYEFYVLSESEDMKKINSLFKYLALLFLFVVQEYFIAYITYNTVGFICFQYAISIATFMISRKFAIMTSLFTPVVISLFLYNIGEFSIILCVLSLLAVLIIFLLTNTFLQKSFTVQFYRYSCTLIFISLLTMNPATGHFNPDFYTIANFLKVLTGCLMIIWFSSIFFREINQKKNRISELEYMKSHDKLTGLYNYREFTKNLNIISQGSDKKYVTVMLDIDDFKNFNDEFGHNEGNGILQSFSKRLLDYMVSNNEINSTLYRFGGEEFCILIEDTPIEFAYTKLNNFINCLEADKYRTESGKEIRVSCSAGISDNQDYATIYETVRAADDALYRAKKEGKGRVIVNTGDAFTTN
ncbi:GGDEF domain-containing protein [Liquorilactobacillus mali]|uniref:GGDEF domain-containing protein n=2 Tax=Liquorilactobacillus mali TaxID=1618 RepID=UPI000704AF40|nr:GGDEF domain-containing protein [Liquorilactobacillus mali]